MMPVTASVSSLLSNNISVDIIQTNTQVEQDGSKLEQGAR